MAGLYGAWEAGQGGEEEESGTLYSYSVITKEADKTMSWLHHRMPVFLNGEQQVAVCIHIFICLAYKENSQSALLQKIS